ncbi:MAG: 30S ribosomal protein S5 [Candidatus Woesearchaeota archaeon]|jgi:small subunit ribosomal protein S5|nr:30S ribosomal protein S5 [Candidatus Woesearchaeota archaeon]MDP7623011.1 30S ribosomal protein S5 [Candidatus Woesearchaeota archaeon]HJN56635.1 30S ribosomal protein S5 [Candidatus Woesearchaeota archaeon]
MTEKEKAEDAAEAKTAEKKPEVQAKEKPKAEAEEKKPEAVNKEDTSSKDIKKNAKSSGRFREFDKESWKPKTDLGVKVKSGEINNINQVLDSKFKILEQGIVDVLLPNLSSDLLLVGQSKGKFGGGQRRVFRQTQKKTQEGNKPKFGTFAIVGNEDGLVGIGYGKSKETVPAREKAIRNAKLNIVRVLRGCGSWQCECNNPHTIPFTVEGKCGSVIVKLMPAPRGTGLCIERECSKILKIAGIKDVWSQTFGQTKTKLNLIYACFAAVKKLTEIKVQEETAKKLSIIMGSIDN